MFTNYYGYKCPKCNSSVNIGVTVGEPRCPSPGCNTLMIPDSKANAVYTNVSCKKCGSSFGMINSSICPCGKPFD
jgi:hypothetical protein